MKNILLRYFSYIHEMLVAQDLLEK
jgi:hypothetical protein